MSKSKKLPQGKPDNPDAIGPVDQFNLCLYASKDARLSACDLAVLFELVDRFTKKDYGPYKAGTTRPTGKAHLERETGRTDGAVKASLARLQEYGYIRVAVEKQGTRGREYSINFDWS